MSDKQRPDISKKNPYWLERHRYAGERVPCCKDIYYELYRRFFWLLDKVRK